uniref:RING-type E3 ubiquitin transferase n=1 Tax=Nelumbo nucifera TaxID=4432 RepID=A0A822XUN0_NELNU|nr:TPA_asm: hypothetical protein HUJ06_024344 [Nelumbo nucifera]
MIECSALDVRGRRMATEFAWSYHSLKKFGARVLGFSLISLQRNQLLWIHILLFLFNIACAASVSSSASRLSYSDHCDSIVPQPTTNGPQRISTAGVLELRNGFYTGGDKILGQNPSSPFNFPKALSFHSGLTYATDTEGVYKIDGSLTFQAVNMYAFLGNETHGRKLYARLRPRPPRFPIRRGGVRFSLRGFWSETTGKLCMVGSGSGYSKEGNLLDLSAVFKLNYPKNSTIVSSLVSGTVESLDSIGSLNYFEPISMLAFAEKNYEYSFTSKENGIVCPSADGDQENSSLGLQRGRSVCKKLHRLANVVKLEYGSDCDPGKNCSPLPRSVGFLPGFMSFNTAQCSDEQRLRLLLVFSNTSYYGYNHLLDPNTTLVAEGTWNAENNQLCIVACRILNLNSSLADASVGDCSIRLTLRFNAILSIRNRSHVLGQLWHNGTMNSSAYFNRIMFKSFENRIVGIAGMRYEYTKTESARNMCTKNKDVKSKGKQYPGGHSYDMRFDMSVKNTQRKLAWGYSTPLYIGDRFYDSYSVPFSTPANSAVAVNKTSQGSLLNVSYVISFTAPSDFKLDGSPSTDAIEISAEGVYDTKTGSLCMVGCRYLGSNHQKLTKDASLDCELLINVQFPSLNAKSGGYIKGTIKSTRRSSDPLFFKPLELSSTSIATKEAGESIWRMDLEISMVLISNTFACVFVGLQLLYVKRNPDVLPLISLVMLVVLTLGHMIPLVLNFEALFLANRNRQNVLLGSGGWLEVNEVIVRVVTMVAFLMQFRLLQLTWSSRLVDGSTKELWVAEKRALFVSLPLYVVGGLIAWFVQWWKTFYEAPVSHARFVADYQRHSLLGDLRSYAGLVLDGFLLPQILLNLFWNSREKALAPSFYVGTTAVRLLPHAYDLYRAHRYVPYFGVSYIYANPGADFYSTAWDVIIPCGGLLFALLIYLQQQFGGRCILPSRYRKPASYEKVPVVSGQFRGLARGRLVISNSQSVDDYEEFGDGRSHDEDSDFGSLTKTMRGILSISTDPSLSLSIYEVINSNLWLNHTRLCFTFHSSF